jgi:hypothetical protein
MLDGLTTLARSERVRIKALLHSIEQVLMLPSWNPPLWPRRALRFERTTLTGCGPVAPYPLPSSSLEAPQLTTRLNTARARVKALKLRLQLETVPVELVVNEDNGEPYDESTYRHWVSTARAVTVFGFLARDSARQAIVRAERLTTELTRAVDGLFATFPLDEENKARRARAVDQRARALAEWLDAQTARDSNGDKAAWLLKPCQSLMFVNSVGELDQKHDQDLRDTCVMLLDRAGCDLLTICDITGHSYRSAQTIVKHFRARNADRADAGIDRLELQVRKEGMKG